MNKSDYDKYYKKGGTYVIPVELFNELYDELERLSFNYEQVLEDLDRKDNIINELEKEIDNFDVFKEFSFPLMKRWEEEQVKSSIDYEWRKAIKEPFLNKIKELKGSDKE